MKNTDSKFRDVDGIDNFNIFLPKITNTLEVGERERRRNNYQAIRTMLAVVTGSDQWDAYTYSELLEGAQNALFSEALRIK